MKLAQILAEISKKDSLCIAYPHFGIWLINWTGDKCWTNR